MTSREGLLVDRGFLAGLRLVVVLGAAVALGACEPKDEAPLRLVSDAEVAAFDPFEGKAPEPKPCPRKPTRERESVRPPTRSSRS